MTRNGCICLACFPRAASLPARHCLHVFRGPNCGSSGTRGTCRTCQAAAGRVADSARCGTAHYSCSEEGSARVSASGGQGEEERWGRKDIGNARERLEIIEVVLSK